jgi:protease-4
MRLPNPVLRRVAGAILTALALAGCSSIISIDLAPRIRPLEEETVEGSGPSKILLLDLSGLLQEDTPSLSLTTPPPRVPLLARVREELDKAEKDDKVRGVVLRINSPGGTMTASDVIYREIREFKARRKVPVIAAIMDVGASGGYYVSLAADQIFVHPTSITGSIGVIMLTVNAQGLLEKIGVAPLAIKSGSLKDAGSPFRGLTGEERAVFQAVIDDMFGRFVRLVAEARKIPEARVREFADGRIYTAEQAHALGLVDKIGYLDEAVTAARQAAGLPEARVIMYHRPREYRANLYSASLPPSGTDNLLTQAAGLLGGGPSARFLYLWWP